MITMPRTPGIENSSDDRLSLQPVSCQSHNLPLLCLTAPIHLRLRQVNSHSREPHRRSRQVEAVVRRRPSPNSAKRDLLPMMANRAT